MTKSKLKASSSQAKHRPRKSSPVPPRSLKRTKVRRLRFKLAALKKLENSKAWQVGRLLLVWGFLISGGLGLGWNLYRLQVVRSPELVKKARNQQMVYMRPYIPRRPITDRNGNVLATDRLVYTLYAHPKLFKISKEEMATKLSKILDRQTPEALLEKFGRSKSGIRLAYGLREDVADKVAALSVDGLELIQQYSRLYPQQELAADAIGYVDREHQGQAGLEYSQQKLLERNVLTLRLNRAGNGALMPDRMPEGLLNLDDLRLQLTLDLRLQRAARFVLKQQLEKFGAKRGAAIVMDVRNGEVLALACEPTYDPNQYYKFKIGLFRNWAIADLYEPGSTFKPVNIAIALENNAIQTDSTVNDTGRIYLDTWEIKNHDFETRGARGKINLNQVLQHSSNVGMFEVVRRMKRKDYYQALKDLDLDKSIGIDLPSEAAGQLKAEKQFISSPVEVATTAFGQGFSLTPLKLVQLHAAIANGGKLVAPQVVKGLVDADGNYQWRPDSPAPRQVFSEENARAVLGMMESVIEANSGRNARIEGYRIAGKSGTSQKASPTGGYYSHLRISSFVGIIPADDPQYVVLAAIDEPKGDNAYGSVVAAPAVKSILEALISIEGIPPSQP